MEALLGQKNVFRKINVPPDKKWFKWMLSTQKQWDVILSEWKKNAGLDQISIKNNAKYSQAYLGLIFVDFWSQGQKVSRASLLGLLLSTSGAKARKSSNRASWDLVCRLLESMPENHQIELPGTRFVDLWSQGWKVFKSSLLGIGAKARELMKSNSLGLVLSTSRAKAKPFKNRGPGCDSIVSFQN